MCDTELWGCHMGDESPTTGTPGEGRLTASGSKPARMTRFRFAVVQVLVQAVGAVALAGLFGAVWATLAARELLPTISVTLYIAAALWLLGAGSLAPRLTKMERMKWGASVSSEDRKDDAVRRADRDYRLPPMAVAVFVALILLALGIVLE
jgi:hypothetical protein